MKIAEHENARLLATSGPRNPYQDGQRGGVQKGAYADLILMEGNPPENIDLVADPQKYIALIMNDGTICKNTIKK